MLASRISLITKKINNMNKFILFETPMTLFFGKYRFCELFLVVFDGN